MPHQTAIISQLLERAIPHRRAPQPPEPAPPGLRFPRPGLLNIGERAPRGQRAEEHAARKQQQQPAEGRAVRVADAVARVGHEHLHEERAEFAARGGEPVEGAAVAGGKDFRGDL
ncbi:hypothetical protein MRB53_037727 [Persea americana]|nr:hypothetical protein MRB53_037727 [Persea americana]